MGKRGVSKADEPAARKPRSAATQPEQPEEPAAACAPAPPEVPAPPPEDDTMSLASSAGALARAMNPVKAIKQELEALKREQAATDTSGRSLI